MLTQLKKVFFTLLIVAAFTSTSTAQTAADSIKAVINKTFEGMKEGDTVKIKECFTDGAFLQTFKRTKDGGLNLTNETVSDFCKAIASLPKGAADEQIFFEQIKMDGRMAAVWTPFKLYINGKFYSCGVNSFQLVKLDKEWKIQYIIDTRKAAAQCN
jgi:hypothetical protein